MVINESSSESISKDMYRTIHLIYAAGRLLKLPQTAIAQATIIFHKTRKQSLTDPKFLEGKEVFFAMACCLLAAKSEESLRQYRDILGVFNVLLNKTSKTPNKEKESAADFQIGERFMRWKKLLFSYEHRVLILLGHFLNFEKSYEYLLSYLHALNLNEISKAFIQRAWNYLNDSLYCAEYLKFKPETLACAAIQLVSLEFNYRLPESPLCWSEFFDVSGDQLEDCCDAILKVYFVDEKSFDPSTLAETERKQFEKHKKESILNDLKRRIEEKKEIQKGKDNKEIKKRRRSDVEKSGKRHRDDKARTSSKNRSGNRSETYRKRAFKNDFKERRTNSSRGNESIKYSSKKSSRNCDVKNRSETAENRTNKKHSKKPLRNDRYGEIRRERERTECGGKNSKNVLSFKTKTMEKNRSEGRRRDENERGKRSTRR